ncbi:MAG: hypothetical protein BWY75_01866 [bacterium ADurb.Bin425]|nr:MAG: hypothetical protein BWY75_01866 [bacterium ADurb.Bin425]
MGLGSACAPAQVRPITTAVVSKEEIIGKGAGCTTTAGAPTTPAAGNRNCEALAAGMRVCEARALGRFLPLGSNSSIRRCPQPLQKLASSIEERPHLGH